MRLSSLTAMIHRWQQPWASADSLTESSWIVVAVAVTVVTLGLIAIRGSPVHRWLHASIGGITGLSANTLAVNPGLTGAFAPSVLINGTTQFPGGLQPSGWIASTGLSLTSSTYRAVGATTVTPVLAAGFPQDSATQTYSNVMTAYPMMIATNVPAGSLTGTAYVTLSVLSASPGWPAYSSTSYQPYHPAHLGVTYVPAGSTIPSSGTCPNDGSCTLSVWGSFTKTTLTVVLPNFEIAPQAIGIDLSDDPQDGAFTWDLADVRASITIVPN